MTQFFIFVNNKNYKKSDFKAAFKNQIYKTSPTLGSTKRFFFFF